MEQPKLIITWTKIQQTCKFGVEISKCKSKQHHVSIQKMWDAISAIDQYMMSPSLFESVNEPLYQAIISNSVAWGQSWPGTLNSKKVSLLFDSTL